VHAKVKDKALEPGRMTFSDPFVCWVPFQSPLAVHEVALAELQERVADWPGSTELGLTESVTCVAGGGATGGVVVVATWLPDPQPERTKTTTAAKQ